MASAINEAGAVVGAGQSPPVPCGDLICYYTHGLLADQGTLLDLGTIYGTGASWANDIDAHGRIVGSSHTLAGSSRAFLWEAGVMLQLADIGGAAYAFSMNDAGVIVGLGYNPSGESRPLAWRSGSVLDLGTLPGGAEGAATDVNEAGLVVGISEDATEVNQPVYWLHGQVRQLEALDASRPWGEVLAVNDVGTAVGASAYPTPSGSAAPVAAMWRHGEVIRLGHFEIPWSLAYDVNNDDVAVGVSGVTPLVAAFVWIDGTLFDLNDLIHPRSGWKLDEARGINDRGQIVGQGRCPCGGSRGFVLTPVC